MEPDVKNKSSIVENLGRLGMSAGKVIGNAFVEFFTGKPLSDDEKLKRARLRELKKIQDEAQYKKDIELAKQGKYIPPESPKKAIKKDETWDIFKNLGKHNPLEGFSDNRSLGSDNFGVEAYGGIKPIKQKDLQFEGYEDNPLEVRRRR